jgi:hypothetical protein
MPIRELGDFRHRENTGRPSPEPKKWIQIRTLMTMWNKDDQFGNFWLERHFDREKDSEKYLKISLSTDRFENRDLEGRLIENALFLIYADP